MRPAIFNRVEAFGLAAVIGGIFVCVAREPYPPFWNGLAARVHGFMAAVNLLFWETLFVTVRKLSGRSAW